MFSKSFLPVLLLFLLYSAHESMAKPNYVEIRGVLKEAVSGKPIPHATVRLHSIGTGKDMRTSGLGKTRADGSFMTGILHDPGQQLQLHFQFFGPFPYWFTIQHDKKKPGKVISVEIALKLANSRPLRQTSWNYLTYEDLPRERWGLDQQFHYFDSLAKMLKTFPDYELRLWGSTRILEKEVPFDERVSQLTNYFQARGVPANRLQFSRVETIAQAAKKKMQNLNGFLVELRPFEETDFPQTREQ